MSPFRLAATLFAAAAVLCGATPAPQQDDDGIFVDEVKKEFLERIGKFVEAKDWKAVFDSYDLALAKHRHKLVRPSPSSPVWRSVVEHLNAQFAKLPPEAFAWYRIENDGKAMAAYQRARADDDRAGLERIVEEFFFSEITDEVLDYLGNRYFEERRPQEAVHFWRKLLETYPDSEIPRAVTAARVAVAAQLWPNERVLEELRKHVAANKIDGPISAGGEQTTLAAFLKRVTVPKAAASQSLGKMPIIPEGEHRFERKLIGVRNEVKRWSYDFGGDSPQEPLRGGRRRWPEQVVAARPEYPFTATAVRAKGRDIVLVTNGQRVLAIDPARAALDQPTSCIRWRFPSDGAIKRASLASNFAGYIQYSMPQFGVVVDGDMAFATLYSEKKVPESGQQNQDIFQGSCRLAAFDLVSGKLRWETDEEPIHVLYRKLDFYERNWSFSGPPLVKGDRLYVGVCTSPIGESESRVLCIDRRTGRPLWSTFVGSVANRGNLMWGGGGRFVTCLTMLAEEGGVIYAHTNIGIAAALHSVSGNILWLSKYPRAAGRRDDNWGRGEVAPEIRAANPVHMHRGRIYLLPQDQWEWQVFDMATGERLQVPPLKRSDNTEVQWRTIHQIVGIVEDWMILAGSESYVVNLVDRLNDKGEVRTPAGRAYSLPRSDVSKCGRGVLAGETIYLPTCNDPTGALSIYHGIGSWKNLDQPKWKEANEYGNLLVTGDYLVVTTASKVMVYTDEATIDRAFAWRLSQSPPDPAAFLEHGDIMRRNDRLVKAAESYLSFVRSAEGDPKHEAKIREVRTELHAIFMRRGDEASLSSDPRTQEMAIEYFKVAQGFAYDEPTLADSTRRLAETYDRMATARKAAPEGKELAKKAVEEYQKIIEKSRDSYHKPEGADIIQKMWTYANDRVKELKKTFGDEVYAPVEKAAQEMLAKVRDGGADALRRVKELYPDSKAAREALDKMLEEYAKSEQWQKFLSTAREMKEKFPELKLELQKRINEALEKLLDWPRLMIELKRTSALYGDEKTRVGEEEITVRDYVARRLEELKDRVENRAVAALREPLRRMVDFEAMKAPSGRYEQPLGYILLDPVGDVPSSMTADHEFFAHGSTVELWNIREKRRVWAAPHPGAFLGASWQDVRGGAEPGVAIVEVLAGSPAETAELQAGDVVVAVDGRPVRTETLDELLNAAGAGARVRLAIRRAANTLEREVTLAEWPAPIRPGVVGAAFTREYGLAVVWEDCAACFDVASGRRGWVFRAIRDRYVLQRLAATDGRLFLHEHFRTDRRRSPLRELSPQMQQERALLSEDDAASRLLCLDDATGEVRWAKSFPFDPGSAQNHGLQIYGDYYGDGLAVFSRAYRGNVNTFELQLLGTEAGELRRRAWTANSLVAWTADVENGVFYSIEGTNARMLRGVRMWGPDADKGGSVLEVQLQGKYMDHNAYVCGLAARGEWVVVTIPPAPAQGRGQPNAAPSGPKVVAFSTKTGKEHAVVPLPPDRTLPTNRASLTEVTADGLLYLYTIPAKAGASAGERRAYVAAFQLGAGNKCDLLWESIAPAVANATGFPAGVLSVDEIVVLFAQRASAPREGSERPIAAIYGARHGGYLRTVVDDLAPISDPFGAPADPLVLRRGRLYVQTAHGLDVYGN